MPRLGDVVSSAFDNSRKLDLHTGTMRSTRPCSGRLFEDDFNNVTVSEGKSKGNGARQEQALG